MPKRRRQRHWYEDLGLEADPFATPPATLFGDDARKQVLGEMLQAASRTPPILVVTGVGGVGKSTLLRAAKARIADDALCLSVGGNLFTDAAALTKQLWDALPQPEGSTVKESVSARELGQALAAALKEHASIHLLVDDADEYGDDCLELLVGLGTSLSRRAFRVVLMVDEGLRARFAEHPKIERMRFASLPALDEAGTAAYLTTRLRGITLKSGDPLRLTDDELGRVIRHAQGNPAKIEAEARSALRSRVRRRSSSADSKRSGRSSRKRRRSKKGLRPTAPQLAGAIGVLGALLFGAGLLMQESDPAETPFDSVDRPPATRDVDATIAPGASEDELAQQDAPIDDGRGAALDEVRTAPLTESELTSEPSGNSARSTTDSTPSSESADSLEDVSPAPVATPTIALPESAQTEPAIERVVPRQTTAAITPPSTADTTESPLESDQNADQEAPSLFESIASFFGLGDDEGIEPAEDAAEPATETTSASGSDVSDAIDAQIDDAASRALASSIAAVEAGAPAEPSPATFASSARPREAQTSGETTSLIDAAPARVAASPQDAVSSIELDVPGTSDEPIALIDNAPSSPAATRSEPDIAAIEIDSARNERQQTPPEDAAESLPSPSRTNAAPTLVMADAPQSAADEEPAVARETAPATNTPDRPEAPSEVTAIASTTTADQASSPEAPEAPAEAASGPRDEVAAAPNAVEESSSLEIDRIATRPESTARDAPAARVSLLDRLRGAQATPEPPAVEQEPEIDEPATARPTEQIYSGSLASEQEILGLPSDALVLQVMVVSSATRAALWFAEQRGTGNYAVYGRGAGTNRTWVVLQGPFEDRAQAEAAARDFERRTGVSDPWVRSVADVQAEIEPI